MAPGWESKTHHLSIHPSYRLYFKLNGTTDLAHYTFKRVREPDGVLNGTCCSRRTLCRLCSLPFENLMENLRKNKEKKTMGKCPRCATMVWMARSPPLSSLGRLPCSFQLEIEKERAARSDLCVLYYTHYYFFSFSGDHVKMDSSHPVGSIQREARKYTRGPSRPEILIKLQLPAHRCCSYLHSPSCFFFLLPLRRRTKLREPFPLVRSGSHRMSWKERITFQMAFFSLPDWFVGWW